MSFVKFHLPCDKCGGSDPVSVDAKGNGYCFSCNTYLKNYDNGGDSITVPVSDIKTYPLTKKLLKLKGKKKIVLPSNNSKTKKMIPNIIQN